MLYAYGAASLASMIASTVGAFNSAKGQKALLGAQADIAEINARMSENTAQSVLHQGQQQVAQSTLKYGAVKSSQKAALAANGVDIGTGSAAEIQASTDIMKEIDSNTIHANAVRSAWGYRTQASNYQIEALTKRTAADGINPFAQAGSSLLTSASKVAQQWYLLDKVGAFDSPSNSGASSTTGVDMTGFYKPYQIVSTPSPLSTSFSTQWGP